MGVTEQKICIAGGPVLLHILLDRLGGDVEVTGDEIDRAFAKCIDAAGQVVPFNMTASLTLERQGYFDRDGYHPSTYRLRSAERTRG